MLKMMKTNLSEGKKSIFLRVPHIKQSDEASCGAAALSMVYKYYGLSEQTEEKIWTRLKKPRNLNPNQEIIYTNDLYNDISNNGLHKIKGQAVWEEPNKILALLREFLRIKSPLIACQRWRKNQPFGHFRIVVGLEKDFVILNDPEIEKETIKISLSKFIADWKNYSAEIIGGEFIAVLDNDQVKEIQKFPIKTFWADIKYFEASNLQFLP